MPKESVEEYYLELAPFTADAADVSEDEFRARGRELRQLPENIRQTLIAEDTAQMIYDVAIRLHKLSFEQAQKLSALVREILFGETSAAGLLSLIQQRLDIPAPVAQKIAQTMTTKIITPNYFQIAQVYEKKRKGEITGSRQQAAEVDISPIPPSPAPSTRPIQVTSPGSSSSFPLPTPPRAAPPRVINLRSGGIPPKLPPPPVPLRGTEDIGSHPEPKRPLVPPAPSVPPGLPLERLTPPAPPQPSSPPPAGAHGPFPSSHDA